MRLRFLPFVEAKLEAALDRSRSTFVLARARSSMAEVVVAATSIVPGEAIVLGAFQHAARVVPGAFEPGATMPVVRRTTSGTGFRLDGGMLFSAAFSSADAAFPDVTPRTLLNRCVRVLLAGMSRAGLEATYLGREWIAHRRHALAVLGLDVDPSGAVLLEAFISGSGSLSIPRQLASPLEAGCERYRGRPTRALDELTHGADRQRIAERFVEGAADRLDALAERVVDPPPADFAAARELRLNSPVPEGAELLPPRPIPIGYLDVAHVPGGSSWVGGDVLAPTFALGFVPPARLQDLPMEGAAWADVLRAHDAAQ